MISTLLSPVVALTILSTGVPAAGTIVPQADSGLPAAVVGQGFGVNIHFTDPKPGEMDRFREAGFGFARTDFEWAGIERVKGVYDFAAFDRVRESLHAVGARPLFILDYGNGLYETGAPKTPEARAAFARFAGAAARHFAGKGVVWELWNEPNLDQFWQPHADAAQYADMAVATARALRAADPHATIIGPGTSTFPWAFLEIVFKAGLLRYIDGVSVHPYRGGPPESAANDFRRLRGLIARYAPREKWQMPIVSSEWGYATNKGGISEDQQARYLTREWLSNLASGVNLSIYYDWKEDGTNPADAEHHFGTVRPDLTPKPAFLAAQRLLTDLKDFGFRHRLRGKAESDYRLLFQRGDSGDLAVVTWSASAASSPADQTPTVHRVSANDAEYQPLRRLASIRLTPEARAEGMGQPVRLDMRIVNAEATTATLHFEMVEGTETPTSPSPRGRMNPGASAHIRLNPGAQAQVSLYVAQTGRRTGVTLRPVMSWNAVVLPEVVAPMIEEIDPLIVTAAPWRSGLHVSVGNPAGTPFTGTLRLLPDRGSSAMPLSFKAGQTQAYLTLPLLPEGEAYSIRVADAKGSVAVGTKSQAYQRLQPFPGSGAAGAFHQVKVIENANVSGPPPELANVQTTGNAPALTALDFAYHFMPGWQYTMAVPPPTLASIPARADALLLWVKGDGSGNDLRSRVRDSTGQTFQADLGSLDATGWRLVEIPLHGDGVGAHWGGANDGVPHPPLRWEALLLIDSASRKNPKSGEVLAADPNYILAVPELPAATP